MKKADFYDDDDDDDDDDENDDFITFELHSNKIILNFSQVVKYSQRFREYSFSQFKNNIQQEIKNFQEEYQLSSSNVVYFFELLQHNLIIDENSNLSYSQCTEVLKISNFFETRKLSKQIIRYIKSHNADVNFIIEMIQYENQTQNNSIENKYEIEIDNDLENYLSEKIDDCFSNEKFKELPISNIYRIIKKASNKNSNNVINNDKLLSFIKKSISKFCVLFQFIEIESLSDDQFSEVFEIYSKSKEEDRHFFEYMKCDISMINKLKLQLKEKDKLIQKTENKNEKQANKIQELESQINQLQKEYQNAEKINEQLKNQLDNSKKVNSEQQNEIKRIEKLLTTAEKSKNEHQNKLNDFQIKVNQLQSQLDDSNKVNIEQQNEIKRIEKLLTMAEKTKNETQAKLSEFEIKTNKLQKKLIEKEQEKQELQKQIKKEQCKIDGQILANVKNELFINARIKLTANETQLDSSKSKYTISTSNDIKLGYKAYENGDPITSLDMITKDILCKSGIYYVRCLVFDSEGKSTELVSKSVTTSGSSVLFSYEGKPTTFLLPSGQYKLEVWGAKGGGSTGKRSNGSPPGEGGLGGYSSGILTLNKNEAIYVLVGGAGQSSNSSDGATTKGGFPDGGGTTTSFCHHCPSVPGTGGGSTSIRIGGDTNYSRVIVAGGGGGASGSCFFSNRGGFGGGINGGNCHYCISYDSQGSGTQTGSTCGLGSGSKGCPGQFGQGAEGKSKSGRDSGGGGGGGWYGGGSGGHAGDHNNICSSGGGGSGWIFTESSLNIWQKGDLPNASKFLLSSSYYLTDAKSFMGNEEFPKPDGNGTEKGHYGNGYAKITPK